MICRGFANALLRQKALLTNKKASLYYMDGGTQTTELIESSGEPWHPLSRFILSDNPYAKHRSIAEIQDLKLRKDKYSLEYAQRESPWVNIWCEFMLKTRSLEFNRQHRDYG